MCLRWRWAFWSQQSFPIPVPHPLLMSPLQKLRSRVPRRITTQLSNATPIKTEGCTPILKHSCSEHIHSYQPESGNNPRVHPQKNAKRSGGLSGRCKLIQLQTRMKYCYAWMNLESIREMKGESHKDHTLYGSACKKCLEEVTHGDRKEVCACQGRWGDC